MKIFFDMDGVLAEWSWVGPDVYSEKGYFKHRPIMENVVGAMKILLKQGYPVCVATKYLFAHTKKEKDEWLNKYFGNLLPQESRVYIPYDSDKSEYADFSKAILIDDYNPNLECCNNAGGTGIKLLNGKNGSSGAWNGFTIDHRSSPEIIAETILAIAERRSS